MQDLDHQIQGQRLVLQMQLDDLNNLMVIRKGKQRQRQLLDSEMAMESYKADIESQLRLLADHETSLSLSRAVRSDADLLDASIQEEEQVAHDREYAQALHSNLNTVPRDVYQPMQHVDDVDENLFSDEDSILTHEALHVPRPDEYAGERAESSAWGASQRSQQTYGTGRQTMVNCASCTESYAASDVARCPCSHEYCRECIVPLFTTALNDDSLFPPRCCGQPIPIGIGHFGFLSMEIVGEFRAKELELETPNRTYCHEPTCSRFIPPQFVQDEVGTCVRCRVRTCTLCKGPTHENECPEDEAAQELLRLAEAKRWQRCYACHGVVELDHGCNHMS